MRNPRLWGVVGIVLICLMLPHLALWRTGFISARIFAGVAVAVVAAIHVYFGLLEATQWNRPAGLQIHGLGQEVADQTRPIGRNMGLYNAMFALLLIGGLFLGRRDAFWAQSVLLALIIAAGLIGTLTIGSAKIVIVQSLPAALALMGVILTRPGTLTEEQAVDAIIQVEQELLKIKTKVRQAETGSARMLRGQHPKSVGFVVADFVVEDGLREDLRRGVFKEPGRRYGAVVRFSNARNLDDAKTGGHGMSIKLFDVEGEKLMPAASETNTQDFLLFDNPVFFVRDAFDYLDFERAELKATEKKDGEPRGALLALLFPRPVSLWSLQKKVRAKPAINPLGARYWSVVPYRLGYHVVKFRVTPAHPTAPIPGPTASSINADLVAKLNQTRPGEAWTYTFEAQFQTDPDRMPIEDAMVDWGQDDRYFTRLATIEIRANESFDRFGKDLGLNWPPPDENDRTKKRSDTLSFSPWHGLVEHEPVGGINRVRRRVYEVMSDLRHRENGEKRVEPEEIEATQKGPLREP